MSIHLTNLYFLNTIFLLYSGSVVKTKIWDFYNELIWLISYRAVSYTHLSLVCAETGQKIVLPPQSSGISSYSDNSCLTFSILALGLSILLTATMISTPAAFAWLIASTVCGKMCIRDRLWKIYNKIADAHKSRPFANLPVFLYLPVCMAPPYLPHIPSFCACVS